MTQCERIPRQLLNGYVKTRDALSKIEELLSPLNAVDIQAETVRRLKENALPLLKLRRDNIEGEILAGLLDPDQVIVSKTADLADLAKKDQTASLKLQGGSKGVAADRINAILIREEEIIFARNYGKEIKILRILAETSRENPISISKLAKTVYGEVISLQVAKNRIRAILPYLQQKLEKHGLIIISKKITNGEKTGREYPRDKLYYYIADKKDTAEERQAASDKFPALTSAQLAVLAIILRGNAYKQVLQKHGIKIPKSRKLLADIGCKSSFTTDFLKESFPLLAQYFRKFKGNRDELLNSNPDKPAQTLLRIMIPVNIMAESLDILMTEIGTIINKF